MAALFQDTQAQLLLRFIRKTPRGTQACRDYMDCSWKETERILYELRDERKIAFANGEWYVPDSGRYPKPRRPKPPHPKQGKLFE